ncbi:filamentous hemagglutinin N-terminal domain-containing protein [Mitsuokella sp. AF33-22]|uniref:beta strand repeat-containing protein n=1 Tax=Mitsuokella sp. AF33-22 TaxID=2292047 RepID=UPI000E497C15|nr:filamentous hemagglutinin N-terminal domain-containing protein [Mitsuokella sp. AF33-22]RHM56071.1 filamentous hemagglutinin N-terminal domain-containing protein [Mitsuokella sp. AF33-22]
MKELYIKRLQRTIALTLSLAGGLYHMAWAAEALDSAALPKNPGTKENVDSIVTNDTTMTITQTKGKNRAFISWDTFNIGKDATVNIKQYSGADLLINAVTGSEMSQIAGKLNATGNVALINPNGVIFMNGAQVNVGGLGVYATGYDAKNGIVNSGKEGNIEIQSGATINVGVSAVLANLKALSIDPKDYAIAIDSTGEDGYTNRIHLVAEGNVDIQGGTTAAPTKIMAKDYTYIGSNASVGDEGFNVGVGAIGMGGKIYIRSDRDADDYGQVIITHGENTIKPVMQSVNGVSIYTNADQADGDDDTTNGINAAVSRTESGDGATTTYYTKHNYKSTPTFKIDGSAYTDGTSVSVDGPGITADKLSNDTSDTNKNKISTSYGGNGATTVTTSLLVNNMDQLQDIEDENTGNLDGRYVLGRAINATDDAHSYIDDGVLYTRNSDGTVKKWSTADGVEITGTKSGGNLSKTVNGTTIGYSKDENKATTKLAKDTELSDGTKLSEETTLSNNGTVTSAENTRWSTTKATKDTSTVTDKTAGSIYTIQSDKTSVVDKDGLTSNTTAKTVTDKNKTYTADISGNTITHTSDSSVTDTNSHTVTKPAGTSDAGYTATIADGTETAAGTSGTIAINGITYTVKDGKVSDTVTYDGSSVDITTKKVAKNDVTTEISDSTDTLKKGTITKSGTSSDVTINGSTTTIKSGDTSYDIVTGTDNTITYTKGTTSADISGKTVTMGKVSVDTNTSKVTDGGTIATIKSATDGTVQYDGKSYVVSGNEVSLPDSTTGETVSDTVKNTVRDFFTKANTALTTATSIYSDYATATSLTNTLNSAITTLDAVETKRTDSTAVQSNFKSAAEQLKSDTTLFNTASTALKNATTALSQYNALQQAISDNTALEPTLKQAYDEFHSTHLDDAKIENIHSDKWDEGKGFNPIGDSTNSFTGSINGFSGERVFGISNLTINRPDEDNVGLVGVGDSADFANLYLSNVSITGKDNVGAIAGTLQNGSHISWSSTSGTVTGTGESIGGFAGLVDNSSMWDISNSATVQGTSTDGTDKKIGGIAGTLKNSSTLTDVRNFGTISGTEDVGGIAGYVENGTILGTGSAIYNYANTYNTGKVTGTTNTGGIVGHAKGIYMYGVFNTNEDAPLSKTSQLIIGDDNKVIQRGDGTTSEAGKSITDAALQSNFGKVKGVTNTGGLVGYLEDAPDFSKKVTNINISSTTKTETDGTTTKEAVEDAPITNNVIDTSYNAGNITGTGENTGGLVGKMTGGTLSNVYNADNNTVLRELGTIPDAVKNAKIKDTSDHSKTYAYSKTKVSEPNNKDTTNNQDLTQYYSFFTVGIDGTRTYYYFLPVSTTSGTTQKGAGGIYVTADGKPAASLPSTSERYYFNRTFNKDANVTGTGKNTGGLVGSMTTTGDAKKYTSGSVIDSAYNAGTITSSDAATTGALVGSKDDASLIKDSFYVTGTDAANGNTYSGTVNKVVGTSSAQDKNIENTDFLDATDSKKKYYVSNNSTRTNFPGVQQKTDTDKDSSGNITATYYEYTSGTNGSFYTDGTGSMDSISHIYPITTTGTTDSSTGKTTYTSTRSTKASYTRQDDGTFKDTSGNKDTDGTIYNATYDTATRQIVLTPVSGPSSNTVVLNAVLAARTANETWTIYEDQTRPLLTAFLNKASLSRTFSYDGTTHNLKTDDVANLYGRADFDGDAGKDVQLSNYQLSSNGVSSEYTYDNTSIWSPQHGYYMDPESTLVINPVNMSANLYGTRVYGDIFNTRGYYVCVPYTAADGTKQYSFYKPVEESGKEGYTLLKGTDSDKALTEFFGKYEQTEDGLLKLAEEKGFYVLELNGFINGEGVDNLGDLITGLVTTLSNSGSTTTTATSGSNLQHLFSSVTADTYLDAGIYNVTNAQITGLTATNQNYTINYGGTLTVKQAELYYTYDGSREYGAQNKDGEHAYTLVGVDSNTADSNGKYTSTHGFLKYWDINDETITIKNDDGTETTITNPYKDFFKKDGDTYEINQDNIGVTGYTAEKTTTTTDVTTGKSTTVKSKDDTKSASLDDIYTNMTGIINKDSINLPSTDTEKVIGSYGDGAVNDDMYTHVLVDKDGKPIGYKVTSFASSNKNADGTIQLYFKASSDTTNTADKNMQAAVDKFNKNYKLVWKEGGTYDKVYTIGDPEKPTPSGDAGIKTETDGLKVNDSTFTILSKTAIITITGNRQYGDTMNTSSDTPYSTTTNKILDGASAASLDKTAGTYNINIDGLTNGDDEHVLDSKKTKDLLSKIDNKDGTVSDAKDGKKINPYTDVARDTTTKEAVYQNINGFEKSKVSVVNDVVTDGKATNQMKVKSITIGEGDKATTTYDNPDSILTSNNYDYILQDGTHQLKITPVDIKVTVNGSKTYGDFNSQAATDYTATASVSGGVTYDGQKTGQVKLKTGEVADIVIANNLDEKSNAGNYSFDSTTSPYKTDGAFTISLSNDSVANADKKEYVADNYDLSFETTYTIGKADLYYTYDGERNYGADNSSGTHTYTLVGIDSDSSKKTVQGYLKSWDIDVLQSTADRTLDNNRLQVKNANYGMTGRAVQAADTDNAVKADNITSPTEVRSIGNDKNNGYSHVIVDRDGKILSYTVDSLERQLAGTSGSTLAKNYNLIWKKAGNYTVAAQERTSSDAPIQQEKQAIAVQNSSYRIDPLNLKVSVTGQRDYGNTMSTQYTTDGTSEAGRYNIAAEGLASMDSLSDILNTAHVENMFSSIENQTTEGKDAPTHENSNGEDGKLSKYTDVKRNADNKSKIDSYSLNVGSTDTSSTITLASHIQTDAEGKVTSIEHADKADSSHGFNVLNDDNYDYVISDGTHTLTINPVNLTVDVKGESTYGKTDTKYTVTSTGTKNGETMIADSGTLSNLVANSAAGSYTANEWTDTTGAATSTASIKSGKYLNTAELRSGKAPTAGTDTDKGIYTVQLGAGENTDGSGLSTFSSNNYNITYHTTQIINPEKLTITIDGTKVYGSQSSALSSDAVIITGVVPGDAATNVTGITDNMNQTLMDAGTYHHDWSSYAGISDKKESYTYVDMEGNSHTVDKDNASGITGVDVQEKSGFSFNNYDIDFKSTYTVTPRTVRVTVKGESTYGDPAETAGENYKKIEFERAGTSEEGLVGGQHIDPSQITVLNNLVSTSDAGTYRSSQSGVGSPIEYGADNPSSADGKNYGISGVEVKDGNGFKNQNYNIVLQEATYTVNKRPLTLTIKGEKTYGDSTSLSGRDYTVSQSGLQNNEKIDFNDATVVHSMETGDRFSNAGEYHSSDNKGILGFDDSTLHGDGFKLGNYELTYDTVFVIDKRPVDVYMESRRTSGSPSSLRMDEPMTMRNVPQEHQGRFLSDLQILDTSPQVIAAGDYPGFDGIGYLYLNFAGDIYRNYMIHRHTVYHILPDRMMKPSVYNAVQPVRRPILDVMYLKVDGSEGINRWNGVQTPKDDGAIILKDGLGGDRTSQPHQPDQLTRPVPSEGMGDFHEEVSQAVPVVYTDGENKELGGRYHLAYENDAVVVRPTTDTAEVPSLRAASVAQEEHKVLHIPYQGAEGEYAVAYADGIVQLYPKNDVARQLAKSKGTDEQLLLRSGLASAVQELGVQLEDIEAVYIFTK